MFLQYFIYVNVICDLILQRLLLRNKVFRGLKLVKNDFKIFSFKIRYFNYIVILLNDFFF